MDQAHLVLRQAEQGIFVKQIAEQVQRGKFRLAFQPHSSIHVLDTVRFTFAFLEDKFNGAAAREKLDVAWTFHHAQAAYDEHGWEASQAFWSEGQRRVTVKIGRGGQNIAPAGTDPTQVNPSLQLDFEVAKRPGRLVRQRTQIELVQLGVALVVTMGALVSGAREQLDKLSFGSSIAVIFALGFGADVVKNIVSRRPSAALPAGPWSAGKPLSSTSEIDAKDPRQNLRFLSSRS